MLLLFAHKEYIMVCREMREVHFSTHHDIFLARLRRATARREQASDR